MDAEKYPESAKLLEVHEQSQAIGEFLEWLGSQGIILSEHYADTDRLWPIHKSFTSLLADFFEIDLNALDKEKQAMLEEYQEMQRARR